MKIKDIASQYGIDAIPFESFVRSEPSIRYKTGFVDNSIEDEDVPRAVEMFNQYYIEREIKLQDRKRKEEEAEQDRKRRIEEAEIEKQAFANSFNEYYEYDVVTILNYDHGQVDKEQMMEVLTTHAKQGWKLHSIYSNELGKNALRILGFGVNATACEDVLIFERRIEKFDMHK